ncbi:MAG: cupin domain-containing protein [Mariprofundaceae bacterium]|nr:cupin domain-containing protein [Mariprofundaceae bacterium]
MKNLLDAIPAELPEELIETIAGNESVRIERIVSHGHVTEEGFWYDQNEDEFVLLLQGEAELEFEDATVRLKKGDCLTIRAHQRHRVKWTTPDQPTIWLAVCF